MHQQDWGVPVRVGADGDVRLVLPLGGRLHVSPRRVNSDGSAPWRVNERRVGVPGRVAHLTATTMRGEGAPAPVDWGTASGRPHLFGRAALL